MQLVIEISMASKSNNCDQIFKKKKKKNLLFGALSLNKIDLVVFHSGRGKDGSSCENDTFGSNKMSCCLKLFHLEKATNLTKEIKIIIKCWHIREVLADYMNKLLCLANSPSNKLFLFKGLKFIKGKYQFIIENKFLNSGSCLFLDII